jgi:hypothetical protein
MREADLNRFGGIEREAAVLKTLFDTLRDEFRKWREGAVSNEDLDKREDKIMSAVKEQLGHICDHLATQNATQSNEILTKVGQMFTEQKITMAKDQLAQSHALLEANANTRREIIRYGVGFALSVIGTVLAALVIFYATGR